MDTTHTIPTARHDVTRRAITLLLAVAIAFSGLAATAPPADAYVYFSSASCSQLYGEVRVTPTQQAYQTAILIRWNPQQGRWNEVGRILAARGQHVVFSHRQFGIQSSRADLHYRVVVYEAINNRWVLRNSVVHMTLNRLNWVAAQSYSHCTVRAR